MAQAARTEMEHATDKATSNVSDLGKRDADKAADTVRRAAPEIADGVAESWQAVPWAAVDALEVGREIGRRSAERIGEAGQAFSELANEQARHGLETFRALTQAADWGEAARLQGEFLRGSIERGLAFNRCCVEMVQTVGSTAIATAMDHAGEATAKTRPR